MVAYVHNYRMREMRGKTAHIPRGCRVVYDATRLS
jgi:hypothetical protein